MSYIKKDEKIKIFQKMNVENIQKEIQIITDGYTKK